MQIRQQRKTRVLLIYFNFFKLISTAYFYMAYDNICLFSKYILNIGATIIFFLIYTNLFVAACEEMNHSAGTRPCYIFLTF